MTMTNELAHDVSNGYGDTAKALIGRRVEIPVHYDLWMRGAMYGVVTSHSVKLRCIKVRMDHSQVRKLVKVWYADMEYMRVL